MKRQFAILTSLLALFVLTASAGDGDKAKMRKHKECKLETQECLNKFVSKLSSYAWDGIHVEGVGNTEKVVVAKIVKDSPGAKAGLQVGDVLVGMNSTKLASLSKEDFWKVMNELKVGADATYAYVRDGHKHKVNVTMTQFPKSLAVKKIGWHMMIGHSQEQIPES